MKISVPAGISWNLAWLYIFTLLSSADLAHTKNTNYYFEPPTVVSNVEERKNRRKIFSPRVDKEKLDHSKRAARVFFYYIFSQNFYIIRLLKTTDQITFLDISNWAQIFCE